MNKKYLLLVEDYMKRFNRAGFSVGDVVAFNDNYKQEECYKQLGQNVKDQIAELIDSEQHIRVINIKDTAPSRYPGSDQQSSLCVNLTVALDETGGRYSNEVTIPGSLVQPISFGDGLAPIPDKFKRKDKTNIKPEELKPIDNPANKTDRGNGKLQDTSRYLATKNTQLPSKAATKSPAVHASTHDYINGLK